MCLYICHEQSTDWVSSIDSYTYWCEVAWISGGELKDFSETIKAIKPATTSAGFFVAQNFASIEHFGLGWKAANKVGLNNKPSRKAGEVGWITAAT